MTVRGKTVTATEEVSVEVLLARAMVAASKVVAADRDPTAEDVALISDAQARAEAAGVEVGAAFAGYQRLVEHRAQLAAEAARREQERLEREERRQHWLGRPVRFKALPADVRLVFEISRFVLPDASMRGSDLVAALAATRDELMLPASERTVPHLFEPATVAEARRLGFTRDGSQPLGSDET